MADKDPILDGVKVRYTGVFDATLLYKRLAEWIKKEKFKEPKEVRYVERVKPIGKIIDIVWTSSREELDGYILMELDLKIFIVGMNDVELDRPNGKLKLNKADLEISFTATLIRNAKNEWNDKSLFKRFYEKYFIAQSIESFKIKLYRDTEKIIDETKNFLALYSFK